MESEQVQVNENEVDVRINARQIIEELEVLDRSYFKRDRHKQIKLKIDQTISLLEERPLELIRNKKEKADILFLRGKSLDFLPEYSKMAEENLSKAIKLLPTNIEAYNALGHVYWKKQDLLQAKQMFQLSLEQDEENKVALRNLSMILRSLTTSQKGKKLTEEQINKNYQNSILLASKAISIDMKDSQSWYILGNAHLTNFFKNNQPAKELEKALKAYSQAEKNLKEPNPDLFFNRGNIFEYLERYGEAIEDFEASDKIDQSLGGAKKAQQIIQFVSRVYNLILNSGKLKSNRLMMKVKSIPQQIEVLGQMSDVLKLRDISQLQSGINPGKLVGAVIVNQVEKGWELPSCFLIVDHKHNFCLISIYHIGKKVYDVMQSGSTILIKDPQLVPVQATLKGYLYTYQSLKITDVSTILVDGQGLVAQTKTQIISKTFV